MRVAIIGGSGFIGTRLADVFNNEKTDFIIIDKIKSEKYPEKTKLADIRDLELLSECLKGISVVINLAAEHRDDVTPKSLYDEVNIDGARNVCLACERNVISKIIFTSSVAVYGLVDTCLDESGEINYFNDYGRTKWEAEKVYRHWLNGDESRRSLTIIRPTVVFGEKNRGNVYNLLKLISSGLFPMVGNGRNIKSMAYVENVASFINFSINNDVGESLFNYVDKPDFDMNTLVVHVKRIMGKNGKIGIHWPYWLGLFGGKAFDLLAVIIRRKLPISSVRILKFCANTAFESSNIKKTSFIPPVKIEDGITRTIQYEFIKEEIN